MSYYFCITCGMDGYSPNTQNYYTCESYSELIEICNNEIDEFKDFYGDSVDSDYYDFPSFISTDSTSTINRRLADCMDSNMVLDIIGMTKLEYDIETEG